MVEKREMVRPCSILLLPGSSAIIGPHPSTTQGNRYARTFHISHFRFHLVRDGRFCLVGASLGTAAVVALTLHCTALHCTFPRSAQFFQAPFGLLPLHPPTQQLTLPSFPLLSPMSARDHNPTADITTTLVDSEGWEMNLVPCPTTCTSLSSLCTFKTLTDEKVAKV